MTNCSARRAHSLLSTRFAGFCEVSFLTIFLKSHKLLFYFVVAFLRRILAWRIRLAFSSSPFR